MLDKNTFMETLHLVQEIAKTSDVPMDRETALSYFKNMELTSEQEELVFRFLKQPLEQPAAQPKGSHSAHFQMYMEEIDKLPQMERSALERLYGRLLAGDVSALEQISHQWLKRVVAIAEEYENENYFLDDLIQEGNMALLLKLQELADESAGEMPEHLEEMLAGDIRRAMEQYMGLEAGEDQQEGNILGRVSLIHEARRLLTEEKGQTPSLEELSEYTKVPAKELENILLLIKEKEYEG